MSVTSNQKGIARVYVLGGIFAASILLFIIGLVRTSDRGLGTGVEYTPPDGPAIMNESEDLYRLVNDDSQFNFIKEDLAVFGRATINDYNSGKESAVVFVVEKGASKNGEEVKFDGQYKKSKDKISVSFTKLKNGRIKSSITNTKTNKNLDSELPSNSKRNQYIGTLPVTKNGFTISYLESSDGFFVALNGADTNAEQTAAIAELTTVLNIPDLREETVSFVTWGANGLPISLPNPDAAGD